MCLFFPNNQLKICLNQYCISDAGQDKIDKSCSNSIYKNILFPKLPVRFVVITCGKDSFDSPIFGTFMFLRAVPHSQSSLIGRFHEIVRPGVWTVPYPVIFRVYYVRLRPKFTFLKKRFPATKERANSL